MKRTVSLFLFLLLILSLLVGGCQPQLAAPTILTGENSLSLYGIDPLTLDPAVSGEMLSHEYIMHLFGGLVGLDDELEVVPDIARSWQISSDGRTYTFRLRQDVRFHDGREVKAGDFKYSWERACNPATGSGTAATYLGDIIGVREVLAGDSREISGVRVVNDYTLEVTIDAPKSYFLDKLAYPTAYVVDSANVTTGREWWRRPNGTGPFKLAQWEENQRLVLERNEDYYAEPAGVDYIIFSLWGGRPMDMYETSEIDVSGVSLIYIDKILDARGPFYQELAVFPELSFYYIGFNCAKPPFDDVNIRRAFSMAVDRDKLISLIFRDMVQRADGILPPGMPGFDPDLPGLDYDVARARELISASKYGNAANLPPITLTTSGRGGAISGSLEPIICQWRENLGVEVTVRQLEPERFLYHLKEEKDEIFDMGWVADYPHPQNFLEILFHSSSEHNSGDYANPEVDALLERAAVKPDRDRSLELYQQAEQLLVADAACLPLWFGKNYILVKPHVKDYRLNGMGLPSWDSAYLEAP